MYLSLYIYLYISLYTVVSVNMNLSKCFVINLSPYSSFYPVFPALTIFSLLCLIIPLLTLHHSIICLLLSKNPFTLMFLLVFYRRAYDFPCNGFLSGFIVVTVSGGKLESKSTVVIYPHHISYY